MTDHLRLVPGLRMMTVASRWIIRRRWSAVDVLKPAIRICSPGAAPLPHPPPACTPHCRTALPPPPHPPY